MREMCDNMGGNLIPITEGSDLRAEMQPPDLSVQF